MWAWHVKRGYFITHLTLLILKAKPSRQLTDHILSLLEGGGGALTQLKKYIFSFLGGGGGVLTQIIIFLTIHQLKSFIFWLQYETQSRHLTYIIL